MIKYLPKELRKSAYIQELYRIIDLELCKVERYAARLKNQASVTTAEDLTNYEEEYGLGPIIADIETKRARVLAKKRGNGILNPSELKALVTAYEPTGCEITEDFENYTVSITFNGRKGQPYNYEKIRAAVGEVKPAHIKIEYVFLKNTWGDVRQKLGTWGNAKAFTWGDIQNYDGRTWLYVDNGEVYLRENGANAYAVFINGEPYARLL